MSHFERLSDTAGRLDFMVVHDGNQAPIPEAEQRDVGTRFENFFDDLQLGFIAGVKHYDPPAASPSQNVIYLQRPGEGTDLWMIECQAYTERPSEWDDLPIADRFIKSMALTLLQDGAERETFRYRLTDEGIVRRHDVGDAPARGKAERELGLATSPLSSDSEDFEDIAVAAAHSLVHMENEIENDRAERAAGINDQPIGSTEFDGLAAFLSDPLVEIRA